MIKVLSNSGGYYDECSDDRGSYISFPDHPGK